MAPQDLPPPPFPPPPPPPPPPPWDQAWPTTMTQKKHDGERFTTTTGFDGLATSIATTSTSTSGEPDETVNPLAASSTGGGKSFQSGKPWPPRGPPPHHSTIAAAVGGAMGAVGALAIICLIVGGCLFCCKKAKRGQNRVPGMPPPAPQMVKTNGRSMAPADTRAYAPSSPLPPPTSLTSPFTVSAPSTQSEEAPILLSTNIDRSYYTGIDTSDALSIADNQRPPSHDLGYAASIAEPPPPYRPTSIPSFSRENSCRMSGAPPSYRPRLSLISPGNEVRSPFDDPEGDSPVSQLGAAPSNTQSPVVRDMEEMSDVSELSYQQEPVQIRSSL